MSQAAITAFVVGIGTFFGGVAALIQANSTKKKDKAEGISIGETALANAVKVVEAVYEKVTGRMNATIDELLEDNQKLREEVREVKGELVIVKDNERQCHAEVIQLRAEVQQLRSAS